MSFNQDLKLIMDVTKQQFALYPTTPFVIQLPDDEEIDEDEVPTNEFEMAYAKQLTKMGLKIDRIAYYRGKNIAFVSPINFATEA